MQRAKCYVIRNVNNDKRYIGVTIKTLAQRWARHRSDALRLNLGLLLHRAIRKHGPEAFVITELASFETWENALIAEREFVRELESFGPMGYNMTEGGEGTCGHKFTREQRDNVSKGRKGKKGYKLSRETRERMSEAQRTRDRSPEEIELRKKIGSELGKSGKGRKHSAERRRKMSLRRQVSVTQMSLSGETITTHSSALDAERSTGVKKQHIYRCCRGIRPTAGGFKWKYADESRLTYTHQKRNVVEETTLISSRSLEQPGIVPETWTARFPTDVDDRAHGAATFDLRVDHARALSELFEVVLAASERERQLQVI